MFLFIILFPLNAFLIVVLEDKGTPLHSIASAPILSGSGIHIQVNDRTKKGQLKNLDSHEKGVYLVMTTIVLG